MYHYIVSHIGLPQRYDDGDPVARLYAFARAIQEILENNKTRHTQSPIDGSTLSALFWYKVKHMFSLEDRQMAARNDLLFGTNVGDCCQYDNSIMIVPKFPPVEYPNVINICIPSTSHMSPDIIKVRFYIERTWNPSLFEMSAIKLVRSLPRDWESKITVAHRIKDIIKAYEMYSTNMLDFYQFGHIEVLDGVEEYVD